MKGLSPFLGMLEKCVTRDLDLEAVEELGVVGRVDVVGPHDERVLVKVGVIALADADGREAESAVELLGAPVRQPYLEREGARAAPARLAGEREPQPPPAPRP